MDALVNVFRYALQSLRSEYFTVLPVAAVAERILHPYTARDPGLRTE